MSSGADALEVLRRTEEGLRACATERGLTLLRTGETTPGAEIDRFCAEARQIAASIESSG